jgi:hypothetical protein
MTTMMKMIRMLPPLALLALPLAALADTPSPTAAAEMAKLASLAGKWKGGGWMLGPRGKTFSDSEETVEARLDGRALLIEGFHTDPATKEVVHHALAILAWDDARGEYRFASALAAGRTGTFPGRMENGDFVWTMAIPGGPTNRFTISLADPDKWVETGDVTLDGGKSWKRFFEMSLARVR